jgi:transcriptional regulator with XRE-family HTH domain
MFLVGYYQRLRDLKEDCELTQKQVAEIIGVSVNHYGKYERGETDIPLEKAIILAEYYNVSLDYLAGRTNHKQGRLSPDFTAEQIHISDLYALLSEKNKGRLELLAEQMLEKQTEDDYKLKGTV